MNMSEAEKQNILGEFYVSNDCNDIETYINAINGFINSDKEYNPIHEKCSYPKELIEEICADGDRMLKIRYFAKSSSLRILKENNICPFIYIDKNSVKHIVYSKNYFPPYYIRKLDCRIGLKKIKMLYKAFVHDVVSHRMLLNEYRNIINIIHNIDYPLFIKNGSKRIDMLVKMNFSFDSMCITCDYQSIFHLETSKVEILPCTKMIDASYEAFMKEISSINKTLIPKEQAIDEINKMHDDALNSLQQQRDDTISKIINNNTK